MQSLFSTPLDQKSEKITSTRCYAISKNPRIFTIYLELIKIDNSRSYAVLLGNPNPKLSGSRTYRTLHIPGNRSNAKGLSEFSRSMNPAPR